MKNNKVLITGISGFVGSHLAEYILNNHKQWDVYGTKRILSNIKFNNLSEDVLKKVEILDCDLRDRASTFRVLNKVKPDKIFHLAAQSFVKSSWDNPEYTLYNNIFSELNILESIRSIPNYSPIIHIAGSSEEYGNAFPCEMPLTEDTPLRPASPYAVSKVAQENLALQYHESYGMKIVITRAFNHEGPRRGEQFVTASFAKQVADPNVKYIKVGNLEAKRDFTDVRDMVRAYWLATEKCYYGGVYNICSERAISIGKVLDILMKCRGTDPGKFIVQDPKRMRPSDLKILLGDCTKFREQTGWKPKIKIEETLLDMYNYYL